MHPGTRSCRTGMPASSQRCHCSSLRHRPSHFTPWPRLPQAECLCVECNTPWTSGPNGVWEGAWGFSSCFQLYKQHTLSPSTQGLSSGLLKYWGLQGGGSDSTSQERDLVPPILTPNTFKVFVFSAPRCLNSQINISLVVDILGFLRSFV